MNKSRWNDSDASRSQSLDKLDNFWIDLNEATTMRLVAKSSNILGKTKTHQQTKSLECEASLIKLERTRRKKKKKAKSPKKCKEIVKFVVLDVYQVFSGPLQLIYIAKRYQVLTDHGKHYLTLKKRLSKR